MVENTHLRSSNVKNRFAQRVDAIVMNEGAFIGRQQEQKTLANYLAADKPRWGGSVIQGEAGVGKTRLLEEVLHDQAQPDVTLLRGACYHVEEAAPYFPFQQMLPQLRSDSRLPDGGIPAEAGSASHALELIDDVSLRRGKVINFFRDAILRATEGTGRVFLCIEDVQWADTGSILVISSLLDARAMNLRIVFTQRTDETLDPDRRQLLMQLEAKSRRIELKGLSHSEMRALVDSVVGLGNITDDELSGLELTTRGNPLFSLELLTHLRDSGLLERHLISEATERSGIPRRLAHVWDLRIRSLPGSVRAVLTACAVYGDEFTSKVVARVTGKSTNVIQACMEEAVDAGILVRLDSVDRTRFGFGHQLYVARLYEMASPATRRRLHRAVARSAEAKLTPQELARHHALGVGSRGSQKAAKLCAEAAEQAVRVGAHDTAAKFWELAVACTLPSDRRSLVELFKRQGWALWAARKWEMASESWVRAIRLFEELGERSEAGLVSVALGELYRWRQDLDESERWLSKAITCLDTESEERQRALALLGNVLAFRGDHAAALEHLDEAHAALGGKVLEPSTAFWLSEGFAAAGQPEKATRAAKEGLRSAKRDGSKGAGALLAYGLVATELCRVNLPAARRYAGIVEDGVSLDAPRTKIRSMECQALILSYLGEWNRARNLSEEWMAEARLLGSFQVAVARLSWANSQLALGQPLAAQRELLAARPYLARLRPVGDVYLAKAFLGSGNSDGAESLLRKSARQICEGAGFGGEIALLGDAVAQLDMPALWTTCYDRLSQKARPIVIVSCSAISLQRVLGRLAARLMSWNVSIEHFETAIDQLRDSQCLWELAQTYLSYAEMRLARHRRGDARKATALRWQASDILESLGLDRIPENRQPEADVGRDRYALTGRELEILTLVGEGLRNQEIADTLIISRRTVERHLENSFTKMGVRGRAEAVVSAVKSGLIGPLVSRSRDITLRATHDSRLSA